MGDGWVLLVEEALDNHVSPPPRPALAAEDVHL